MGDNQGTIYMALVEIGRFDMFEAHIVAGRLEAAGIPAVCFDTGASIADGSAFLIPVRVMVDDEDESDARELLSTPDTDPA
jgi:hypothetical protein